MAELTSLNIKIDRNLKSEADALFNAMGMNMTTAVNIFVRQAVMEQAIPFQIRRNDSTQFHKLIDDMRSVASKSGFMSDDDINAEIKAARSEIKARKAQAENG